MNDTTNSVRSLVQRLWREVAKFGVVGGVAFIIDVGLTFILAHTLMSGSDAWARVVGASVATVFAWIANRSWTFKGRSTSSKRSEFVKFGLINLVGMGISAGFTFVAKYAFDISDTNWLWMIGNVGIVVATVLRFFAYRLWVFREEIEEEIHELEEAAAHSAPAEHTSPLAEEQAVLSSSPAVLTKGAAQPGTL